MTLKPLPSSGQCVCGNETLTLARDTTDYFPAKFEGGKWVTESLSHSEESDAPEAVRLFCPDCGEYYQVPEELA